MSAPIAIGVVSYETRDLLDRCLRSLAADQRAGLTEVWVVDNASTDGSAELVAEQHPWARLIASEKNLGFGPAVNLVAQRSSSRWLIAANADVAPNPGAISRLIAVGEADPRVGALAPRLIQPDGRVQHSVHPFPAPLMSLAFALGLPGVIDGLGDRLALEGYWDPERARDIDWAHGALLAIRTVAFDQVGGFDPEQWMYAEDIDIQWRLHEAGWTVRYVPEAAVAHEVSAATRVAFGPGRTERHIVATQDWIERRRSLSVLRAFSAINVFAAAIRWLPARIRGAESAVLLGRYLRTHAAGLRLRRR